jgi:hypothetical protein
MYETVYLDTHCGGHDVKGVPRQRRSATINCPYTLSHCKLSLLVLLPQTLAGGRGAVFLAPEVICHLPTVHVLVANRAILSLWVEAAPPDFVLSNRHEGVCAEVAARSLALELSSRVEAFVVAAATSISAPAPAPDPAPTPGPASGLDAENALGIASFPFVCRLRRGVTAPGGRDIGVRRCYDEPALRWRVRLCRDSLRSRRARRRVQRRV